MMNQKLPFTFSQKILLWLSVTVFVLLALHMVIQYINWEVFYQQNGFVYELSNRFDLDDESSVGTWFSQLLLLMIGLTALLSAYLERKSSARQLLTVIGIGSIVASLDEVASLHEFILQSLHNLFFRDRAPTEYANAWILVLPLILAVFILLLNKMVRVFNKRMVIIFGAALAVFLLGAVGVDQITSLVERESFLHQGVLVALEESSELFASVIILYTLARYVENNHASRIQAALEKLKA